MALNVGQLFATLSLNTAQFTTELATSMAQLRTAGNVAENEFGGMADSAGLVTTAVAGIGVALAGVATAMGAYITAGVKYNANLEQTQIAYKYLTGSATQANKTISSLKRLAKETPFEFDEINQSATALLNAGINAEDLEPALIAVADASAVTGTNMKENFTGASTAIGQMLLKGKITGEEMTQLAERGIPAWEALSRATGKSVPQLQALSQQSKLGVENVKDLIRGLSELRGGASAEQATTFTGLLSSTSDTIKEITTTVTGGSFGLLKSVLKEISEQITDLQENADTLDVINLKILDITASAVMMGARIYDAIVNNGIQQFKNLENSAGDANKALEGIGGEALEQLANTILGAINLIMTAFAGFITTLTALFAMINGVFSKLMEFKLLAFIVGIFVGLRVTMLLLNGAIRLVLGNIMALTTALTLNAGAVGTATGFWGKLGVIFGYQSLQSGLLTALIGAETVALIQQIPALQANTAERARNLASLKTQMSDYEAMMVARTKRYSDEQDAIRENYRTLVTNIRESSEAEDVKNRKIQQANDDRDNMLAVAKKDHDIQMDMYRNEHEAIQKKHKELNAIQKQEKELLDNAQKADKATGFAQALSRVGTIAGIVAAVLAALTAIIVAVEYAIFGTTESAKYIVPVLTMVAKWIGSVLLAVLQALIWTLGLVSLALINTARIFLEVFSGSFADTSAIDRWNEKIWGFMNSIGGKFIGTIMGFGDAWKEMGEEAQKGTQKTEAELAILKMKLDEVEKIRVDGVIRQAQSGVQEAIKSVRSMATVGKEQALAVIYEIDKAYADHLLRSKKTRLQQLVDMVNTHNELIKVMRAEQAQITAGTFAVAPLFRVGFGNENETMFQFKNRVAVFNKAKKDFEDNLKKQTGMKPVDLKSAEIQITNLTKEIKILEDGKKALEGGGDTASAKAQADKEKRDKIVEGRKDAFEKALDKKYEDRKKEIENRNNLELEAIEKFYDAKEKAIQDGIDKLRAQNDEIEEGITREDLIAERERIFYSKAKEAVERRKEIDRELAKMDRDKKLREKEALAEAQKDALDEQRDVALRAQEEINEQRLAQLDSEMERLKTKYEKVATDFKQSQANILKEINTFAFEAKQAGKSFVEALVDGIASQKKMFDDKVKELVEGLDLKTMLGEFKSGSQLFTDLLTIVAVDSNTLARGGTVERNIFITAPLFSADKVIMGDKLDAEQLGKELWSGLQATARTQGYTVAGRG